MRINGTIIFRLCNKSKSSLENGLNAKTLAKWIYEWHH